MNRNKRKIQKINLENATARKAKWKSVKRTKKLEILTKTTEDQRLKWMNAMLDHKIAMKAKMKTILNDEQYAKWEKAQARMAMKGKKRMKGKQKGDAQTKTIKILDC